MLGLNIYSICRYKGDGAPCKNAKKVNHSHRSLSIENKVHPRVAHCARKYHEVRIYVKNKTQ